MYHISQNVFFYKWLITEYVEGVSVIIHPLNKMLFVTHKKLLWFHATDIIYNTHHIIEWMTYMKMIESNKRNENRDWFYLWNEGIIIFIIKEKVKRLNVLFFYYFISIFFRCDTFSSFFQIMFHKCENSRKS